MARFLIHSISFFWRFYTASDTLNPFSTTNGYIVRSISSRGDLIQLQKFLTFLLPKQVFFYSFYFLFWRFYTASGTFVGIQTVASNLLTPIDPS